MARARSQNLGQHGLVVEFRFDAACLHLELAAAFSALFGPSGTTYVLTKNYPIVIRGESNVTGVSVDGELLTSLIGNTEIERSALASLKILGSPLEILSNGGIGSIPSSEMHSMALLIAIAKEPRLGTLAEKLPGLYETFIDKSLYGADTKTSTANFLEQLVRAEYGSGAPASGSGALKKFTDDLTKLVGDAGIAQTQLQRELTIVAMEYYYFKEVADATSIFNMTDGGLHFKYSNIGATHYKSLPRLASAIEGLLGTDEKSFAGRLASQNAWHIQQGSDALNWTATDTQYDAAIGGVGVDILNAGAGSDILVGGANADVLTGGIGSDTLLGGQGYDFYQFANGDGGDTIVDADGQGEIKINGITITGGKQFAGDYWCSDDRQYDFSLISNGSGGTDLLIGKGSSLDRITIRNWQAGQLGIQLSDAEPLAAVSTDHTLTLSGNPGEGQQFTMTDSTTESYSIAGTAYSDRITAGAGNDQIAVNGGIDKLNGGAGNDRLYDNAVVGIDEAIEAAKTTQVATTASIFEGGTGDDLLVGGVTNYLYAGGGKDTLIGGGAGDILQGDTFDGGYGTPTDDVTAHFDYDDAKHKFHY